jgi:hypothetical protein
MNSLPLRAKRAAGRVASEASRVGGFLYFVRLVALKRRAPPLLTPPRHAPRGGRGTQTPVHAAPQAGRGNYRFAGASRETAVSFDVMNSSSAGVPLFVCSIPRLIAGTISPGSVTRSP